MRLSSEAKSLGQLLSSRTWFQEQVVEWFRKQGRKLPWRETSDPYAIWISESMCQQTGVSTVVPYYLRFLERFPNLAELAQASEHDVMKAWEGLGYYRRAKNIHAAAKILVSDYASSFPSTREELLKIPGIGPYTAGAILSIAFRVSTPALDGNLIRVYSRFLGVQDPVDRSDILKKLWKFAEDFLPSRKDWSRDFAEGLMDLGALICTPKSPRCFLCPLQTNCAAYETGMQSQIPMKEKKSKRTKLCEWVYWDIKKDKLAFLPPGSDPKYPDFYRLVFEQKDELPPKFRFKLKYAVTTRDYEVFVVEKKLGRRKSVVWLSPAEAKQVLLPAIDRKIIRIGSFQ